MSKYRYRIREVVGWGDSTFYAECKKRGWFTSWGSCFSNKPLTVEYPNKYGSYKRAKEAIEKHQENQIEKKGQVNYFYLYG